MQIASNDDCPGTGVLTSCLNATLQSGQTYAIQVDGYRGAAGTVSLSVSLPFPVNDNTAE